MAGPSDGTLSGEGCWLLHRAGCAKHRGVRVRRVRWQCWAFSGARGVSLSSSQTRTMRSLNPPLGNDHPLQAYAAVAPMGFGACPCWARPAMPSQLSRARLTSFRGLPMCSEPRQRMSHRRYLSEKLRCMAVLVPADQAVGHVYALIPARKRAAQEQQLTCRYGRGRG